MSDQNFQGISNRKRGRPKKEDRTPEVQFDPLHNSSSNYVIPTSCSVSLPSTGIGSSRPFQDISNTEGISGRKRGRPRKENMTPLLQNDSNSLSNLKHSFFTTSSPKMSTPGAGSSQPLQDITNTQGQKQTSTSISNRKRGRPVNDNRTPNIERNPSSILSSKHVRPLKYSTRIPTADNINPLNLTYEADSARRSASSLYAEESVDYENIEFCQNADQPHPDMEDDISITADSFADYISEPFYDPSDDEDITNEFVCSTSASHQRNMHSSDSSKGNTWSVNYSGFDKYVNPPNSKDKGVSNDSFKRTENPTITKEQALFPEYRSLGGPSVECPHCHALMWNAERVNKKRPNQKPIFSLCCAKGTIKLPDNRPTPKFLLDLHSDKSRGSSFRRNIRIYNSMLSFTSTGWKIDTSINRGRGPYVFRLNGINYHRFGSLLPSATDSPKFCQLYIYDTENEINNRINTLDGRGSELIDAELLTGLLRMLDENNELVKTFRMARDRFQNDEIIDLKIVMKVSRSTSGRENHISPSDEVAAIIVGDNEFTCGTRDIVIESRSEGLKRISNLHLKMMALQYPLLFPYGEDGYHENIYFVPSPDYTGKKKRKEVSQMEYYAFNFMVRMNEGFTMRLGGRLYQQYLVDSFSAVEQSRLWYIHCNQQKLRHELYNNLCDIMKQSDTVNPNTVGQGFILPATFVGSARYMQQNFQDSLAVCRKIGWPDLFLTMTCNPFWDEILKMMSLLPVCRTEDCPDIIARVFKLKLDQLNKDIKKNNYFGPCKAVMYVVEYQKRGLPHAHMLIWLEASGKQNLKTNIDAFICAEIPDETVDPYGYAAVKMFMIHGPCGVEFDQAPCMRDFKCTRNFPKKYSSQTMFDEFGFPIYKRRKTKNVVHVRKATLDNQWVVPYNRDLLVRYQCHINIEACNHGRCMKYLFKYCLKGPDRATLCVRSNNSKSAESSNSTPKDEIKTFLDGRYVCGPEAAHRIFGFDIHHRSISVERLCFHMPNEKFIIFDPSQPIPSVVNNAKFKHSKLEAFFYLCQTDEFSRSLTYQDLPEFYVWHSTGCFWQPRKQGTHYGRLNSGHYSTGELWYLRMLLPRIRGPRCFQDLRTIDGVVYPTFKEACAALGLLNDDKQWHETLSENERTAFPYQLRLLFVHIIANCQVSDVLKLWQQHWNAMADDIVYNHRKSANNGGRMLTDLQLQYYTLAEIEKLLNSIGKSLKNYPSLPMPPSNYLDIHTNRLVVEETSYNINDMKIQHQDMLTNLNKDQRVIYDAVIESVEKRDGQLFFVYGSGGCGKTYLWKTLISKLRSELKIVLPVASSGIAATLLPGGRTAHSRFKIPIKVDESSTCSIRHNSDIAELIKQTRLIIWDEAPMQNMYAFESLDRSLRDIMRSVSNESYYKPFGGITVLLGGDFRQILRVVLRGSRSDIVSASISRSPLWNFCRLFKLNQNMRLTKGKSETDIKRINEFGQWLLNIGDAKVEPIQSLSTETSPVIKIPDEYCIITESADIDILIDKVFPDIQLHYKDINYFSGRAILTPRNKVVDHVNNLILEKIPGESYTFCSVDTATFPFGGSEELAASFPVEVLNSMKLPGMPPHELILKENVVVMLLRNINQSLGLCNGTRMIIKKCQKHSIICEIIGGNHAGTQHLIPRMEITPSETNDTFTLTRVQFPLQVCFAITINKAQGQSLDLVGLYLPESVFCHGQLYVALSRVTSPDGLIMFINTPEGGTTNVTKNVVFEEIFYNL